jgi:membrane fusion protein, multidrug efflux system
MSNRIIVLVAMLGLTACGNGTDSAVSADVAPVRVAMVETASSAEALRAVGVVTPADEVRLAFKTGGIVRTINVEQGDRVRRGQLLATLADDEVAAAVSQAQALADKAARDFERGKALLADEVATREQVEDLGTASSVAASSLRTALFNARYARIEAPADGVVQRRLAEPDELVAAGQPVLVVGNTDGGWIVRAALSDRDVVRVKAGMTADVTLDAFPGQQFPASVTEIAAAADPQTGTYEVKLAVDRQGRHFVQGLVAKVSIADQDAESVPVIPVTALLEADGKAAVVFVVAESEHARRVAVQTGRLLGERIEIVSGLAPGDRVVTEGAAWLDDDAAVRVLDGR